MTRRLGAGLALAALGAVSCRLGDGEVPIGSDEPSTFWVSPAGDDRNPGTRERPFLTLAHATQRLAPGQTLLLADGDYRPETTGTLAVDCRAGAESGRAGAPISVRAENERGASLHGDGELVPLVLEGCAHWLIDGLLLSNEHRAGVLEETDVGSVALLSHSQDVTLRRLLMQRPNRERHSHVLRVIESERVLVEECEAYDFFHNAFEAVRTFDVVFRRNYLHSRFATSAGGGADDPTRGEVGIQIEESGRALLENNLVEVVGNGFAVVGRSVGSSFSEPLPEPPGAARLYGNLVRDALGAGFRLESRCDAAAPCEPAERIASDTLLAHGVVLDAEAGVAIDAAPGTRVERCSAVQVVNGFRLLRDPGNAALAYSASVTGSLARGFSGVGFWSEGADDWSFEGCLAQAPGADAVDYSPADAHVSSAVTESSEDACVAYPSRDSALRGAGPSGTDLGAEVVQRYLDGVLTSEPLWDPQSGAFPCGVIVPGVNDDPSQSCSGAHQRLRVGSAECPLPDASR